MTSGHAPSPTATQPLAGQRVVVTRSRAQAGEFTRALQAAGAVVLEVPVIRLAPPSRHQDLKDALLGLNAYDWLVFTSVNGVSEFFRYFFSAFDDLRDIGGVRIAAVGPATAAALKALHLRVDVMPAEALGRNVVKALKAFESLENLRFCLLRAERANPDLPDELEAAGAIVDDIAVYQTVAETEDATGDAARLAAAGADWLTFTSASTVAHFHARLDLPQLRARFPALRVASIGPETTTALAALGVKPDVEAKPHTTEGLLQALTARRRRRP